jgi:tetratricopeptide (TPR) repeat protein
MAELRGDPSGAGALLARAIRRLAAAASDDDTPEDILQLYLRARVGPGRVRADAGALPAAERTCRATLRWARAHPGPHRTHLSAALNGLGVYLKARGRYAEALALYRRARRSSAPAGIPGGNTGDALPQSRGQRTRARGPAAAVVHAGVACACDGGPPARTIRPRLPTRRRWPPSSTTWETQRGQRLYRRALRYYLRRFGERSYEVSVTLANLGALYHNLDDLRRAEQHFRRGPEHR